MPPIGIWAAMLNLGHMDIHHLTVNTPSILGPPGLFVLAWAALPAGAYRMVGVVIMTRGTITHHTPAHDDDHTPPQHPNDAVPKSPPVRPAATTEPGGSDKQTPSGRRIVMALHTVTTLIDDIDGRHADQTVTFGLDGIAYEIDLHAANAAEPRATPYDR